MLKEGIEVEYLDSSHLTVNDLLLGTLFLKAATAPPPRKDDLIFEVTGDSQSGVSHGASNAVV
jgi:hypothetical protein